MAAWIKMPLGMEVGLGPDDFVLDGDPVYPLPKKGRSPPIFSPRLLWPNGCMDEDATWYGGRPQPGLRDIVLDGNPAPPPLKGHTSNFWPTFVVPNCWMD